MSKEKYTLAESAAIFGLSTVFIVIVMVVTFPLSVFTAWLRTIAWNWYAPSLRLPHLSVWMMMVAGWFTGMFRPTYPDIKDDLLKYKAWQRLVYAVLAQILAFLIIACVHIWFKG